jgi:hypothetical protein
MCTEFFLALIYFLTIIVVNYFLFRLLRNYLKNIFYLLKIQNILKIESKNNLFKKLYKFNKKEFQNSNFLKNIEKKEFSQDVLLLGNVYKYLSDNIDKGKNDNTKNNYYFTLLTLQYLSINFKLK